MLVRIHAVEPASLVNGPGRRAVVWFQGCTLGCPGCFNPDTHSSSGGSLVETAQLAEQFGQLAGMVEGVSISGGEPFQQPEALLDLLERLPAGLGRLVFTGYTLDEVKRMPLGQRILRQVDALVAGRYVAARHLGVGLLAS